VVVDKLDKRNEGVAESRHIQGKRGDNGKETISHRPKPTTKESGFGIQEKKGRVINL